MFILCRLCVCGGDIILGKYMCIVWGVRAMGRLFMDRIVIYHTHIYIP